MKYDYIDYMIIIVTIIVVILFIGTGCIIFKLIFTPNILNNSLPSIASTQANITLALVSIIAVLLTVKYTKEAIKQTKITIKDNKSYNEENLKRTDQMIKDNKSYNEENLKRTDQMIKDNKSYNEENLKRTDQMIKDNKQYNQKSVNQTTELIEQNEKNSFVQLRFHNAENALYNLMNELQIALLIYDDLEKIDNDEVFLNQRGFLLVQYLNLVSDTELLEFIPLRLRSEFQYQFLNRLHASPNKESEEYVKQLNSYDYNKSTITQSKIIRYYEFNKIIKKFNENCISGHFIHTFRLYYSSCITEKEMEEHMRRIIREIANHKPEELILEEKDLEIIDYFYSD